jgi:hypothetical protein
VRLDEGAGKVSQLRIKSWDRSIAGAARFGRKIGHSGYLVGGGHKVTSAAMEVDGGDEVPRMAKAPGRVLDLLNLLVDRFAGGVGNAVL